MNIVLMGYRGSGKTTIGAMLADRLWRPFVDLDERLVARAGKSIKHIFEQEGEEAFRNLESELLLDVLRLEDHVIALGGGAVIRPQNREAIKTAGCKVIYLRCDPAALLRRIQADTSSPQMRPALTSLGGGLEEITLKLSEREALYQEVASAELDVTNLDPEEAVVRIVKMV